MRPFLSFTAKIGELLIFWEGRREPRRIPLGLRHVAVDHPCPGQRRRAGKAPQTGYEKPGDQRTEGKTETKPGSDDAEQRPCVALFEDPRRARRPVLDGSGADPVGRTDGWRLYG